MALGVGQTAPGTRFDSAVLIILEGSAHAQAIFETDQGARLMGEILRFLSEP